MVTAVKGGGGDARKPHSRRWIFDSGNGACRSCTYALAPLSAILCDDTLPGRLRHGSATIQGRGGGFATCERWDGRT